MTDDLDTRIRALVRTAVADAPAAPPTPNPVAPVVALRRPARGWGWAAAAVASAAAVVAGVVVLGNDDDPGSVAPATSQPTTASTSSVPESVPPLVGWREDLVVIVASERGIERVSAEQGAIAQSEFGQPLLGDVAFELPDGTVVSDDGLIDVGLDGTALYTGEWNGWRAVYQYPLGGTRPDVPLMIPFDGEPTRLTYSADQIVGEGELFAGGRTPLRVTQDGQFDISTFLGAGVAPPLGDNDEPRLFSVSPTGRTVVWVHGNELVVSNGTEPQRLSFGDGSKVVELDVSDSYAALTRADGPGTIVDLRDGSVFQAPSSGRLTLSMMAVAPPVPSTTVPTAPTSTYPLVWGSGWNVVATGGTVGVRQLSLAGETQWTDEPMAAAVLAPDGSMIVQRESGYPGEVEHTMADTLPLRIATPGAEPVSLFGDAAEPVDAWYTVHDAATVNGRDLVLFERQYVSEGFETEAGDLLVLDLGTGEVTMLDDNFGGWEQGSSRLHLAETGLVIGEYFDSAIGAFYAVTLDGSPAPTAADLGLEPYYGDCSECPRRYTVSRDGATLAWLDGNDLVVQPTAGGEATRYDLGDDAVGVADMAIGDGYVVLSYSYAWMTDTEPPLVVLYAADQVVQLPGRTAVIAQ